MGSLYFCFKSEAIGFTMYFKGLFVVCLILVPAIASGLHCYSCSATNDDECINHPEKLGEVTCPDGKDHCYTMRLEMTDDNGDKQVQIQRSCCKIKPGSPSCPPGDNFQKIKTNEYTRYLTRCSKDLCNNSKGNSADGGGGDDGDKNHNGVIVPGTSKAASLAIFGRHHFVLTSLCFSITLYNAVIHVM